MHVAHVHNKIVKWAIKVITSQVAHFLWGNMGDVHKYHLANWGLAPPPKSFGGLGLPNLREFSCPSWLRERRDILLVVIKFGCPLWIINIILTSQMSYGLGQTLVLLFGKVPRGQ